ncbi:MAG: class I SAM-dependent methyltransferase [Pirellulaceae bacterium]
MKIGDRILQRWRIAKAAPWIKRNGRLLDVGCADGAIFKQLSDRISGGVGIDPDVAKPEQCAGGLLVPGFFPENLPDAQTYDAITMLAVLEHIPQAAQAKLAADCFQYLNPGGRLIITVPSPFVDHILSILKTLRIVDGMSLEEHYGFKPADTRPIFETAKLRLIAHRRFQLGLNHLFVFEK